MILAKQIVKSRYQFDDGNEVINKGLGVKKL